MATSPPNKETIKTKDRDGNELSLDIRRPSGKQLNDAGIVYSVEWQRAFDKGCILHDSLDEKLRSMGIWDDAKESQRKELEDRISQAQSKIEKGGIRKLEAKDLAFQILEDRGKLRTLLVKRNRLEANTAEAIANNAQFNYLVSQCTVYSKDGSPYFKDMNDYLERMNEEASVDAASKLYSMINSVDDDAYNKLPEVKFLKKYKFISKNGFILNDKGEQVDDQGRLVNDKGQYIDGNGGFVDKFGNPVDEKGDPIVEFSPFLDEEGNPIPEESENQENITKSETVETI